MNEPNINKVVTSLQAVEKNNAEALKTAGRRQWMDFADLLLVGKFEYEKLHKVFDRTAGNAAYIKGRASAEARSKDVQTAQISVDLLAAMERDWRMRTRTRIRMFAHAAARKRGNGLGVGPLYRNTVDWLGSIQKDEVPDKAKS